MMKIKGTMIFKSIRKAAVLLLALFVVLLISSCSPETLELCRVGISTEETTRNLTATLSDPLNTYKVYYRSIYKGTGASYGDMKKSNSYNLLDSSSGILISQGLWEIEVLFKSENVGPSYTPSDVSSEITGSSGVIFINLNTTSISINVDTDNLGDKGNITVEYSLNHINVPATSAPNLSIELYRYNNDSFIKIDSSILVTKDKDLVCRGSLTDLEPGIYYAVFTVTGTIAQKTGTISVDSIGFVVRGGMTTKLEGTCTHSYTPASTGNIVIVNPDTPTSEKTDIRNFVNNEFTNDTIYKIDNSNGTTYYLFPDNDTFIKTLNANTNITIDTYGVNVVNTNFKDNSEKEGRTYFVLNTSTSLTLLNSVEGTQTIYGCSDSKIMSQFQTNFRLNGGTLTIGTNAKQGQLNLKGCSPKNTNIKEIKHPAIEFAPAGGTVKLIGGNSTTSDGKKLIQIEDTIIGIGTDPTITSADTTEKMNISIDIDHSYINAQGNSSMNAYGIYIDGFNRTGSITITVKNYATINSSRTTSNGCGIYIKNFNGSITINVLDNSEVKSSGNYGIHIDNCKLGAINITKSSKSTISGNESDVYINGTEKIFSANGTITIPAKNRTN